ncbi:MAG TPA: TlpA family protein disulfide reductase [Chloroflexus aurantiacus]|jgi:thiol-disulfide isomerase/thioredoxin|uniref:Alkyl hydroperoxide reductase/ Thiol specific antioxidant/ Mal allergen n=2 Tax=Chloroflexaceae TaxID=1106 RepID=A9WIC3_CHLAA|nr:alkyl hydroperoxide reductase/ Thiol specific antioxidant/ Mal allergen [Chloroflexus aurantiacus J-10-fl]RMG52126.1 MAG: TlpA family protein disulfide reductase [Chloroflexota bacterium]GIV94617.1 MAG: alkyl hydroperoxide reductase [Chloroflexus sp.]HBW66191.1 TlpA family protein disulfide reductase [Chloroflexus aurantiacus]
MKPTCHGKRGTMKPKSIRTIDLTKRTMKRLIILLSLILVACGTTTPPSQALLVGDTPIAAESRLIDTRPDWAAIPGEMAPDFSYTLADGTYKLSDLRGKPVIVNFWATWCLPCVEEMPTLDAARRTNPDLVILAVNRNESTEAISAFAPKVGVSFPLITDRDGVIGERYGVINLPTTFFINSDGTIAVRHVGALTAERLAERLAEVR